MNTTNLQNKTILIVDDNQENLKVLSNILKKAGYKIRIAMNGKQAINSVATELPDLILLDIQMPELDGFQTCNILQTNELYKKVPIIFVSALTDTVNKVEAFNNGGVDYITKPFHFEEVLARVQTHLTIAQMRKEREETNIMLEKLVQERTAELQIKNEELNKEIEERKAIEKVLLNNNKELSEAKLKAEESDKLKTAFLNNLSHEIRTPLNGILGFSDLLCHKLIDHDSETSYFLNTIQESGNQLLEIINDILDMSLIETKQLTTYIKSVDLEKIINNIFQIFNPRFSEKNVKLNFQIPQNLHFIKTDSAKIENIFKKILSNSLKFTEIGEVNFGFEIKNNFVEFFVKDTGIGINKEFHEIIFEPFRQIIPKNSGVYGGSGLGLAIAKAFVEKLNGEIWLQSSENQGTCVYFKIPDIQN